MDEMIWENVHEDQSLEYPFKFFAELPTLQQLASYGVCQEIWREYISFHNVLPWDILQDNNEDHHEDDQLQNKVKILVEGLKLPRPVEQMLKQDVEKTYDELKNVSDHFRAYPFNNEEEIRQLWFEASRFSWLPNGEIDYRRSATDMLNSGRLNEKQKFFIMSIFCMENEMKTISQGTILCFASQVNFYLRPLLFYWVCYLRNELKIPQYPLEKTICWMCWDNHHRIGMEYFWHRLTNDDRISLAEDFLRVEVPVDFITTAERLCSSISSSTTISLVPVYCEYVMMSLKQSSSLRYSLLAWHRFKNQFSGPEFADIFVYIFENVIGIQGGMQILEQVWDTAHDHQREYVVQHRANRMIEIFASFFYNMKAPCSSTCSVICRILLQKPEDQRLKLLLKEVDNFASHIKMLSTLKKVLDSCLPNYNHRSRFNYALSHSTKLQESCAVLLEHEEYAEFDRKLNWVFSDHGPNALNEYKKMILASMTWKYASKVKTFFANIDKWTNLSEFIDQTYAEDQQSAVEVKRRFLEVATEFTRYDFNLRQSFNVIAQIAEMILPAQDLGRFKCNHLYRFGRELLCIAYWNDLQDADQIFFQNFVEWCCDGDIESISKFKKSLPPGPMLDAMVGAVMNYRFKNQSEVETLLHRLDWYLEWFVGSAQKVTECKIQAVQYSTIDVTTFNRWASLKFNQPYRKILLGWLCGGDEATLEKLM